MDIRLLVPLIGLAGVVVGAVVTRALSRWGEAVDRRRSGYSDAVKTLVAYAELPYRIRRRTADSPEELHRLADLGHDIQENLRCHRTWVRTESGSVGDVLDDVVHSMRRSVGPACQDAWTLPAVTKPHEMNLGDWGPGGAVDAEIDRFERAVMTRFGVGRVVSFFRRGQASAAQ